MEHGAWSKKLKGRSEEQGAESFYSLLYAPRSLLSVGGFMGMTLAEKILARASGQKEVVPGQYVTAEIDLCMAHEGLAAVFMNMARTGWSRVWDPSRIVSVLDHYVPAPTERSAEVHKVVRTAVKQWGIQNFYGERAGICHQVLPEKGHVLPGMLIVGTDSHTTTYGAFGAAGTGIGFTDMAYVFATGKLWFKVPETIQFDLNGKLPQGSCPRTLFFTSLGSTRPRRLSTRRWSSSGLWRKR